MITDELPANTAKITDMTTTEAIRVIYVSIIDVILQDYAEVLRTDCLFD